MTEHEVMLKVENLVHLFEVRNKGDLRLNGDMLDPEILSYIARNPGCGITLLEMVKIIYFRDRSTLLEKVWELMPVISDSQKMDIWLWSLEVGLWQRGCLRKEVILPLFDTEDVLKTHLHYFKPVKRYQMLCGGPKRVSHHKFKQNPILQEMLYNDAGCEFLMYCDMAGQELTFSILQAALDKPGLNIFRQLLETDRITPKVISLEDLCIFAVREHCDSQRILALIEQYYPGTLKKAADPLGRNLLWTALLSEYVNIFKPACELLPMLLEAGCDPDNKNHYGITWRQAFCDPRTPKAFIKCCIYPELHSGHPAALVSLKHAGLFFHYGKFLETVRKNGCLLSTFDEEFRDLLAAPGNGYAKVRYTPQRPMPFPAKKYYTPEENLEAARRHLFNGLMVYHPRGRKKLLEDGIPGAELLSVLDTKAPDDPDIRTFLKLCGNEEKLTEFIQNSPGLASFEKMKKLLFYAAAHCSSSLLCLAAQRAEHRFPGLLCRCRDAFGSSILWYAVFNADFAGQGDPFTRLMRKYAIRMTSHNAFGLSPLDIYSRSRQETGQ